MKTSLLFMVFALLSSTTFSQSEHHCSHLKSHGADYERSATLSNEYIALTNEYDVHFYFLDLNIERTATDVSGTVEIHVTTLAPVLDSFLFELHENLVISSLKLNGITTMAFTREGSAVIVPVDFEIGDTFFMEIMYAGTPPTGVDAFSRGMSNETSGAWGNQVTWSLSEPFYAYEWFPSKQSLTDKADSSWVFVTTDASNMAGSNGLLTQVVDLDFGKQRYEWKSNYPIEYYLISIAVAEYIEYTIYAEPDGADEPIMIQNFIYNNTYTLPYFEDEINNTADFVELFSDLYGLYPFANEKYGHCMAPISGGMEHQTMTTQGYFDDWLTAHELGHQWFGDNVTCSSWQDIWLNEGFASYSEELMMETYTSGDEIGHMFDRHSNIMIETGGSVWVEDTLNKGRIFSGRLTYDKGAAIVHTLRFLIDNDDLFFEVLETYQTTFAGSTANLADFKGVAEDVTGMDFTNFFNEWYYGEGYVKYSIEYAFVDETLIVVLKQESSEPTSVPYFTNDLEIRVFGEDGEFTIYRLENVDGETSFHYIPYTQDIINIYIDPNNWIINRIGSIIENENLASLIESKQVSFKLYPNPTTNTITIENGNATSKYSIYDELGKKVMEGEISSGNNTIEVGSLSKGNYFIYIDGEESTFSKM